MSEFFKFGKYGKEVSFAQFVLKLNSTEVKNNKDLQQLISLFDTDGNGVIDTESINGNKSEARSLFDKLRESAMSNNNIELEENELTSFIQQSGITKGVKSIQKSFSAFLESISTDSVENIETYAANSQEFTPDEIKAIAVTAISDDVRTAKTVFANQLKQQGWVSDFVDDMKETFDTDSAAFKINQFISEEELCASLLQQAQDGTLTQRKYLEQKLKLAESLLIKDIDTTSLGSLSKLLGIINNINPLYKIAQEYINFSHYNSMKGAQREQAIKVQLLRDALKNLKPDELNGVLLKAAIAQKTGNTSEILEEVAQKYLSNFKIDTLVQESNEQVLVGYKNLSTGKYTPIKEGSLNTNVENDSIPVYETRPVRRESVNIEQINPVHQAGTVADEMQTKGERLKTFEETFRDERGVEYDSQKIMDYTEKYAKAQLIISANSRYNSLKNDLNSAVPGLGAAEAQRMNPDVLYPEKVLQLELTVVNILSFLCKGDKIKAEQKIHEICGGEYSINGVALEPHMASSSLEKLVEYLQKALDNNMAKLLDGKTVEDYINEASEAYKQAYGDTNSRLLSEGYAESQQEGVQTVKSVVQTGGMAVMIAGQAIPVLGQAVATVGLVTSTLGGVAVDALENYTKEGGATEQDKKDMLTELGVSIALVASGIKIGQISESVFRTLVLRNCPKLLAFASEVGVDATMSLVADYAITGQIDLSDEGISQLQAILVGIIRAKGSFKTYINTHAGDVRTPQTTRQKPVFGLIDEASITPSTHAYTRNTDTKPSAECDIRNSFLVRDNKQIPLKVRQNTICDSEFSSTYKFNDNLYINKVIINGKYEITVLDADGKCIKKMNTADEFRANQIIDAYLKIGIDKTYPQELQTLLFNTRMSGKEFNVIKTDDDNYIIITNDKNGKLGASEFGKDNVVRNYDNISQDEINKLLKKQISTPVELKSPTGSTAPSSIKTQSPDTFADSRDVEIIYEYDSAKLPKEIYSTYRDVFEKPKNFAGGYKNGNHYYLFFNDGRMVGWNNDKTSAVTGIARKNGMLKLNNAEEANSIAKVSAILSGKKVPKEMFDDIVKNFGVKLQNITRTQNGCYIINGSKSYNEKEYYFFGADCVYDKNGKRLLGTLNDDLAKRRTEESINYKKRLSGENITDLTHSLYPLNDGTFILKLEEYEIKGKHYSAKDNVTIIKYDSEGNKIYEHNNISRIELRNKLYQEGIYNSELLTDFKKQISNKNILNLYQYTEAEGLVDVYNKMNLKLLDLQNAIDLCTDSKITEYINNELSTMSSETVDFQKITRLEALAMTSSDFDGTTAPVLSFFSQNKSTNLSMHKYIAERLKMNLEDTESEQLREALLGEYANIRRKISGDTIKSDFVEEMKLFGIKDYIKNNNDETISNYLYEEKYLSYLKENNVDASVISRLDSISKKYNTRIFLSLEQTKNMSSSKDVEEVISAVEKELEYWIAKSNGQAKLPPIVDFTSIKTSWYDTHAASGGMGAAAAYSEYKSTKSISFSTQTVDCVLRSMRHEMTHSNDLKQGQNIDPKYNLDEIMPKREIKFNGQVLKTIIEKEKCKYWQEFVNAGIPEETIRYGHNNPAEYIAVAAEGDMSKYSPEFKQLLIDFGMPEWMFNID